MTSIKEFFSTAYKIKRYFAYFNNANISKNLKHDKNLNKRKKYDLVI